MNRLPPELHALLREGTVIPAHPLALTPTKTLDERGQAALTRYYVTAGAGGVAVGVHTTQFEIHAPNIGLLRPVLALASEIADAELAANPRPFVKIAGVLGDTKQAERESRLAGDLGYDAVLVSLAAFGEADDTAMLEHCRHLAEQIPVVGFYLQPAVGGRTLSYSFWRAFVEIENVVAIKVAPFNRYQTLDVVRAVSDAGRAADIALYTGNDDNIVVDLMVEHFFGENALPVRFVGGLLGHWAVWTKRSVETLQAIKQSRATGSPSARALLTLAAQTTEANAAIFDAVNTYAGCLPGINYVLAKQGLVREIATLNPREKLSPGQIEEIERIRRRYPHLHDDDFVAEHLHQWLR